jgi:hypothetical protein
MCFCLMMASDSLTSAVVLNQPPIIFSGTHLEFFAHSYTWIKMRSRGCWRDRVLQRAHKLMRAWKHFAAFKCCSLTPCLANSGTQPCPLGFQRLPWPLPVHQSIHIYIYIYVYMYVYTYVYTCVCMYVHT